MRYSPSNGMNGIHDMGGMHGFGPVVVQADEPIFHSEWEKRVLGMAYQMVGFGWTNIDAFRHAIERMEPTAYLSAGYYGRWLDAVERLLVEAGVLAAGDVAARIAGEAVTPPAQLPVPRGSATGEVIRTVDRQPRFAVGDRVRARIASPPGHTRLPRYVAGRHGVVHRIHPACVFPDSNAHFRGEDPQYLYNVRFEASALWGADAEPGAAVHIDLFEPYIEPA
jgi:nitrile hydratase beta subunit